MIASIGLFFLGDQTHERSTGVITSVTREVLSTENFEELSNSVVSAGK